MSCLLRGAELYANPTYKSTNGIGAGHIATSCAGRQLSYTSTPAYLDKGGRLAHLLGTVAT